ncbi:MAG: adenylate cyclase regulatory domain-containing protein, partial [Thermodesulfobacteriota bacterium]
MDQGAKQQPQLTLDDVVERTGEAPERLLEWRALRLIGSVEPEGFAADDVGRVHLIRFCIGRGVSIETIVRAERAEGDFIQHYLEQLLRPGGEPTYSLAEAAAQAGLDVEVAQRLHHVSGPPWLAARVGEEDVEMLRGWKVALDKGLPEEALSQLVRVYADALGRVAEAEARLFHFYVHEPMRDAGLSRRMLRKRTESAGEPMRRLIEPALLYFHRKGMSSA